MERHEDNTAADRQITSLAARLSAEGVPPERDLWPDIDRTITAKEKRYFATTSPAGGRNRLRPLAVAAVMALLLVSGGVMVRPVGRPGRMRASQPVRLVAAETGRRRRRRSRRHRPGPR